MTLFLFLAKLVLTLCLVLCLHTCHRPYSLKNLPFDFDGIMTTWQDVQHVPTHQKAMCKSLQDISGSPPVCIIISWGKYCLSRPPPSPECHPSSVCLANVNYTLIIKGSGDKWWFMEHSLKTSGLFEKESAHS